MPSRPNIHKMKTKTTQPKKSYLNSDTICSDCGAKMHKDETEGFYYCSDCVMREMDKDGN